MLIQQLTASAPKIIKRNIGILAPAFQEAKDPIQKLFLDKIREYKAKSSGGKLVDVTPEIEKERQAELDRVKKQFNIKGNPTEFPKFKFQEPVVEQ